MSIFSKIKSFFNGGGKESEQEIDVNKPVTNPILKKAFENFHNAKTEANLEVIGKELIKANLLLVINNSAMQVSPQDENGRVAIKEGSQFSIYLIYNEQNEPMYPLFTDWEEIDLWFKTRENITGWIVSVKDAFDLLHNAASIKGLVINPSTNRWNMNKEQAQEFIKDYNL